MYNKRRKTTLIGHILRSKCVLKHATEGKLEGKEINDGKTRKKSTQLLDDIK
jgi:hypothetical protein